MTVFAPGNTNIMRLLFLALILTLTLTTLASQSQAAEIRLEQFGRVVPLDDPPISITATRYPATTILARLTKETKIPFGFAKDASALAQKRVNARYIKTPLSAVLADLCTQFDAGLTLENGELQFTTQNPVPALILRTDFGLMALIDQVQARRINGALRTDPGPQLGLQITLSDPKLYTAFWGEADFTAQDQTLARGTTHSRGDHTRLMFFKIENPLSDPLSVTCALSLTTKGVTTSLSLNAQAETVAEKDGFKVKMLKISNQFDRQWVRCTLHGPNPEPAQDARRCQDIRMRRFRKEAVSEEEQAWYEAHFEKSHRSVETIDAKLFDAADTAIRPNGGGLGGSSPGGRMQGWGFTDGGENRVARLELTLAESSVQRYQLTAKGIKLIDPLRAKPAEK